MLSSRPRHLCHGWGLEYLSEPEVVINLEGVVNGCCNSTGAWSGSQHAASGLGFLILSKGGKASLPFLWLYTRQTVLEDEDLLKEIQGGVVGKN